MVPMRSISRLFADIVIDDLETDCNGKQIFFRDVDEIACIPWNRVHKMINICDIMNDERLQFTSESKTNNTINFLDVLIIKENKKLTTDCYKEPTFSGRTIRQILIHS